MSRRIADSTFDLTTATLDDDHLMRVFTTVDGVELSRKASIGDLRTELNAEAVNANVSFYVRSNGNDSNTGKGNTKTTAFKTIQKALNVVSELNLGIYTATIYVTGVFKITTGLTYNGNYGHRITIRAVTDPITNPDELVLAGTLATDIAAVRASHSAIIETASSINMINTKQSLNIQGIAFIYTGSSNPTLINFDGPNQAIGTYSKCSFIHSGIGVICYPASALCDFSNCLFYGGQYAVYTEYASIVTSTDCKFAYQTVSAVLLKNFSHFTDSGSEFITSTNSVYFVWVIRKSAAHLVNSSFSGGGQHIRILDQSACYADSCIYAGAVTRIAYSSTNSTLTVNGGSITSGQTGFYADFYGLIMMESAPSGSPTYSPSIGTIGNSEGYIV